MSRWPLSAQTGIHFVIVGVAVLVVVGLGAAAAVAGAVVAVCRALDGAS